MSQSSETPLSSPETTKKIFCFNMVKHSRQVLFLRIKNKVFLAGRQPLTKHKINKIYNNWSNTSNYFLFCVNFEKKNILHISHFGWLF